MRDSENTVRANDVYVGDVWLYLSQSWHMDGPDSASRWSVYKTPGRYYRNDGYYLGLGLVRCTGAPVGILGLGASTLESMTPPEGFEAFSDELGDTAAKLANWSPHTRRGKEAYLDRLQQINQWVRRTHAALNRTGITYKDFTQPPQLPGPPHYQRAETTHYNFVTHRFRHAAIKGSAIKTGPTYKTHRIEGRRIIVEFENVGEGLMFAKAETGKAATPVDDASGGAFQIAAADGQWCDAKATIEGKTVVVTRENVNKPVSVRYAWSVESKEANLYNSAGFAALPFAGR